jgi:hypothetical protein
MHDEGLPQAIPVRPSTAEGMVSTVQVFPSSVVPEIESSPAA